MDELVEKTSSLIYFDDIFQSGWDYEMRPGSAQLWHDDKSVQNQELK